jgi:hypothetical protein
MHINETALRFSGGHPTYGGMWRAQRGPEFFDMGTLVRLATTVETLLRDYYRAVQGLPSGAGLGVDRGVFQRLMPWSQNSLTDLYQSELSYDLNMNVHLPRVRELMAHRHLYAHTSGLITDDYLTNWLRLTGEDLTSDPALANYPNADVYWFRPLRQLESSSKMSADSFASSPQGDHACLRHRAICTRSAGPASGDTESHRNAPGASGSRQHEIKSNRLSSRAASVSCMEHRILAD